MKLRQLSLLAVLALLSSPAFSQVPDQPETVTDPPIEVAVETEAGQVTMNFPSLEVMQSVLKNDQVEVSPPDVSPAPQTYAYQQINPVDPPSDSEDEPGFLQRVLDYFTTNYEALIMFIIILIEAIMNYIPTSRDWSGLKWLLGILQFLVPNRDKTGGRHQLHR